MDINLGPNTGIGTPPTPEQATQIKSVLSLSASDIRGLGTAAIVNITDLPIDSTTRQIVMPLEIPSPSAASTDGVNSVTHTSVCELPITFNGFRYAMAFTPYGSPATSSIENPCVVYSNDKENWTKPTTLTNPIASYADAVAAGFDFWSDPEILYDDTNSKLLLYYRGVSSTPSAKETIFRQTSTNGTTWTPRTLVLDGPGSASTLLSPSVVKESATNYTMWVVVGNTSIKRYSSTDAGLTFTASATPTCVLPFGLLPWHAEVRKYQGFYYLLVNASTTYRLTLLQSTDGITFTGNEEAIFPFTGTNLDSGGYYRSAFLPKGGYPCDFDIWAVAMSGNLTDGNHLKKHRPFYSLVRNPFIRRPYADNDFRIIKLRDDFNTGNGGSTAGVTVGQTPFYFYGTGSVTPGLNIAGTMDITVPGLGGCIITTGATAGNVAGIQDSNVNWPMSRNSLTKLIGFKYAAWFKQGTSAAGDTFYIGFGSHNLAAAPGRFVGISAIAGTDTYYQLCARSSGSSTTSSSVLVSSGWHKVEITSDNVANWLISIDESIPQAVPWTLASGDGMSFGFWEKAGTNVAASLYLGPWMIFGIDPNKQ